MSFKNEFEKIVVKLPIIRDVVAIVIGAVRGIMDVINNPAYDKQALMRDMDIDRAKRIIVDEKGQHYDE